MQQRCQIQSLSRKTIFNKQFKMKSKYFPNQIILIQQNCTIPSKIRMQIYIKSIIQIKGVYLVLEYANSGSLYQTLLKRKGMRMEEEEGLFYIKQIVDAVSYLHSKKIIHRDLKSENLLISKQHENSPKILKLCDFGWSNVMTHEKRKALVGTLEYLPPEILKNEVYTLKVDIWSLAVIIHELFTGRTPFESTKSNTKSKKDRICEIQNNILNTTIKLPGVIPPGARDLLKKMFKRNPENRYDIEQVKNHWWISGESQDKSSILPAKSDEIENDKRHDQSAINQQENEQKDEQYEREQSKAQLPMYQQVQMDSIPKIKNEKKGSEMASQIAQARQSIIKKIHHQKNNSQNRNRTRTTSVFWDLQNQKVQLQQQNDFDKKIKEFKILKQNLSNQALIYKQQNQKILETLENYSQQIEGDDTPRQRTSLITYENYDLDARIAFLEILVTKMIPAQKSQKICLKNKLEQQKVELEEQNQKIGRIENLKQELEEQNEWKNKIIQHQKIMWNQVNEIIENKNLMAFKIGQIDTEKYIEKKFEKYKPQEIIIDDDWLSQIENIACKFEFQYNLMNAQQSVLGEQKNILDELKQNSQADKIFSDKHQELQNFYLKKFETLEGQYKSQQEKVNERKNILNEEMMKYKSIIERREQCEKELQELNGKIKETNKNIKLLEEQEIDFGFDLKAQNGKIQFMREQIRDMEQK